MCPCPAGTPSELPPFFADALWWPAEVLRHARKGLDVSLRPFLARFEDHGVPLPMHQDRISIEPKLLWQTDGLTSAGPKDARRCSFRFCGHDSYQRYLPRQGGSSDTACRKFDDTARPRDARLIGGRDEKDHSEG